MEDLIANVTKTIEHLEKAPKMFCSSNDFLSIADFVSGFFCGIELSDEIELHSPFSDWVKRKSSKTSLIWWAHILHVLADNDERIAYQILFKELRAFLADLKTRSSL